MSFKGQQVALLAAWELYRWIRMRGTMTSLSERPLRSMGSGTAAAEAAVAVVAVGRWGGRTGHRDVNGEKD